MHVFLLDASALVKRFAAEKGTDLVNHLFANAPARLSCLMLGAAEVSAALVRKRNSGVLAANVFAGAMAQWRAEVLDETTFLKLPSMNPLIYASVAFQDAYALNATDAVLLRAALDYAATLRTHGNSLVIVLSDQRLRKACQTEGLVTF